MRDGDEDYYGNSDLCAQAVLDTDSEDDELPPLRDARAVKSNDDTEKCEAGEG